MGLSFEHVTPRGVAYATDGLERVVVRRREDAFDPGSEVAIYAHHSPLLMQTQACTMRLVRASGSVKRRIGAGVLEVYHDRVTFVETEADTPSPAPERTAATPSASQTSSCPDS